MEPGIVVIILLAGAVVGVCGGWFFALRQNSRGVQGILNVDCSNPEEQPGLWLQLEVPIENVIEQKQAKFIVNIIR